MKTKHTDFTLQIPDAEGKLVRRVKVKVPVEWDEAIGEWMMTPEALRMVEDAKMRFFIDRINEINEWRREAVLHAETAEAVERIDARVLYFRHHMEK